MSPETSSKHQAQSAAFWNEKHARGEQAGSHSEATDVTGDPLTQRALRYFGDLRGRKLLDLGCGSGNAALFFARQGAEVTAVDVSDVAIDGLRERAAAAGVTLRAQTCGAMDIAALGPFDFIFGSLILHHIEPFDRFAAVMRSALHPGGRAYFFENSAKSKILIWFRTHVVGRLWVPKRGDPDEFPLTEEEVGCLERHFRVEREVSEIVFLQLAASYLLRGIGEGLFRRADAWLYRWPRLHRLSYTQHLYIEAK